MNTQRRTVIAALAAAGLPAAAPGAEEDRARLLPDRRRERMAHRQHRVDQGGGQGGRHQAQVLRCAAEAGKPDQGDPLVHRAEGRRHRLLAGGRDRLGDGAAGGQGREDPGDPHRPRRRREGRLAVRHVHRLGLRRGRPPRRPLAGRERPRARQATINIVELQGTVGSAPAIDRKKGFEEIIKADPRYKIIRSQTGDFTRAKGKEVMEAFLKAEGKKINVLLRAQRRHGDRRDPGDRGSRA